MLAASLATAAIFHGAPVPPADVPWLAQLTSQGPFCGGALIAPDRVMTAAHCVQGSGPNDFQVRVNGKRLAIKGIYFPPRYRLIPSPGEPNIVSASGSVHDIAVIALRRPVDIAPLPLAQAPPTDGEATLTVGHGQTTPLGGASLRPLAAAQIAQPNDACLTAYGARLFKPARHLCTRDPTPSASQACPGDSGSAVMVRRDGILQAVGVVTWGGETLGRVCGEGPADVSERVFAHLAFLTGPLPQAVAPYSDKRVRVRRVGSIRRCMLGRWRPAGVKLTVRWFRRDGARKRYLPGTGTKRKVRSGRVACEVTARTAGGWVAEESYNTR
jgi:hypothetical protein